MDSGQNIRMHLQSQISASFSKLSLIQDMNKREKKMYIMYEKVETIYQQNTDLLQNTII